MSGLLKEVEFKLHEDFECDEDCIYCEMEREQNEKGLKETNKRERKATFSKFEKTMRK